MKNISLVLGLIGGGIGLWFLLNSFVIVQPGNTGVAVQLGKVLPETLPEGFHIKNPLTSVKQISTRVETLKLEGIQSQSKDLQQITNIVTLNYRIDAAKASNVFKNLGSQNEQNAERIIRPILEESFKVVSAKYTAEEFVARRSEVKAELDTLVNKQLEEFDFIASNISINDTNFTDKFNDAIEAKQVAEQNAKRAEFVAKQAKQEAEAEVNRAKGAAEAQRLQQLTLTPEIVALKAVEKWDGKMPLVVGKEGMPFINLDPSKLKAPTIPAK